MRSYNKVRSFLSEWSLFHRFGVEEALLFPYNSQG